MADALEHRGPDDRGYFLDEARGVGLAHNRLSIIDLSAAGHQPMLSEDGRTALIYNGELYNFQELKRELQQRGHQFRSRTDTEVVLRAFLEWGPDCLARFCGMFALALWSADSGKLLLARDPLGMKPLYYTALPGGRGIAFASEIKAFLRLPDFHPRADRGAIRQFLDVGYTFDPQATSLEGVAKLPPGHFMEVVRGQIGQPRAYWMPPSPDARETSRSRPEREEELYGAMQQVVAEHLIADVPVGLLLSGGLDSSVVAALAARQQPITTVTMGFAGAAFDERPHARMVSRYIGSDHHEVTIHPDEISGSLESVVWYFDDLFADWGTISTRLLYQRCREMGMKVVLVGEGSDEIFGGYGYFRIAREARGPRLWTLFQLYRRYAGQRFGKEFLRFSRLMHGHLHTGEDAMFEAVRRFEVLHQLPNHYVMKVDKASMSVSVEARAPFLDRRVAEIALRTPPRELLDGSSNKLLLRSMAERFGLLPPEITRREKFGGSIALSWMDDSPRFRAYARDVILDGEWVDELGMRGAMTDYFDRGRTGYRFPRSLSIFQSMAWRLLLLSLWSRRYAVAT